MNNIVLLIEPDAQLAATYIAALQHKEHKVVWRRTAASAVAALDEAKIGLVVLELNLALHNGLEFLYEIRSYPDLQDLKIILHTTVRKAQVDFSALKQLGIIDYLYKPSTSLEQLLQSVKALLHTV